MNRLSCALASAVLLMLAGCQSRSGLTADAPNLPSSCLVDPWTLIDNSSSLVRGSSAPVTVTASSGSTRSHLVSDPSGSRVSVHWTAGDSFLMFAPASGSGYYAEYFYTSGSGESAEFTSSYGMWPDGTAYHSFYPSADRFYYDSASGTAFFGLTVPVRQNALAGGIEEGLNFSYAFAETSTADLHFSNVLSLLRFSLSGSGAASVDSIVFRGTGPLAGDVVIAPGDGIPYVTERHFAGTSSSNTVTLRGPFTEGEDYYLALLPGTQNLSLTFRSGTLSRTVIASSAVSLQRSRVADIGTLLISDDFFTSAPVSSGEPEATLYMEASEGTKPVTLVVLSEGFTSDELDNYKLLAKSGIDFLFSTEPYKTYRNRFNVWIISVASNESGASVTDGSGTVTEAHDCYFGSRWGEDYGDMQADASTITSFVETYCPDVRDGIHTRAQVPVLLIINDSRYGGICHFSNASHGYCMVPTYGGKTNTWLYMDLVPNSETDPDAGYRYLSNDELMALHDEIGLCRGDWRNVIVHEFGGHCIARLSDEYWYYSYSSATTSIGTHNWSPLPFGLNISASATSTPWQELLDGRDALIATNPLYSRIGVFQGGDNSFLNRWRSEFISCMIDDRQYFSTWQRELIVRHIFDLCGDTFSHSGFLASDDPTDPLRDTASASTRDERRPGEPCRIGVRRPSPVFHTGDL